MKVRLMKLKNYKMLFMNGSFVAGIVGLLSGLFIYFILIPKTILVRTSTLMAKSYFSSAQLMPRMWAILIIISSIGIIYENLRNKEEYLNIELSSTELSKLKTEVLIVIGILLSMSLFVFLMPRLGYVVSGIILLLIFIYFIFDYRNIKVVLPISLLLPIFLKWFFESYLYIFMPTFM